MKESEAFLHQARSDYALFRLLLEQDRITVPACHPLHYLQMTTEKLAKAMFRSIDELNPSVGVRRFGGGPKHGPNTEYPWPARDSTGVQVWHAPANHSFDIRKHP